MHNSEECFDQKSTGSDVELLITKTASNQEQRSICAVATAYPHLVLLGVSYFFVKLCKYLALLWLPLLLHEELHLSASQAGLVSIAFDAGSGIGTVLWGVVSDRPCMGGRRI